MRSILTAMLVMIVAGCGSERGMMGFFGPSSSSGRAALTVRVVDDPSGAVSVSSNAFRPNVSLVFEVTGVGTMSFPFTGPTQVQMTIPLDSAQANASFQLDSVPTARFDRVNVRLVSALLAIPGDRVPSRDIIGGGPVVVQRPISLQLQPGGARTIVIDLNSGQWLRPVTVSGEPPFAFDGASAFINALSVRIE
jgi:hypothetical protein